MQRVAKSIHRSKKATIQSTEPSDWGLNYPEYAESALSAAVAMHLGNSPIPATMEEMTERNPYWDQDVYTFMALLQFQLDQLGESDE